MQFAPRVYYLNLTDSEPIGLYRITPLAGEISRGEMVFLEVPRSAKPYIYGRGWLPKGWLLLKHVGAVAGDEYCIKNYQLTINNQTIGPIFKTDSQGLPLPYLKGRFRVPQGYFLPIATRVTNSFDGRYFRAIPTQLIKGKAIPLITF